MDPNCNQMKIQKSVKFNSNMFNQLFFNRINKMVIQNKQINKLKMKKKNPSYRKMWQA